MILREVRCSWASVTEPNTKFDDTWEIVAHLDTAKAAVLADHGFKLKTEDDGTQSYRFKRKCQGTKRDGSGKFDKEPPSCIDSEKNKFSDLIGNGSLVNIQYAVKTTSFAGNTFISGDLEGVQVLEHVQFSATGADEFGDEGSLKTIEGEDSKEEAPDSPF